MEQYTIEITSYDDPKDTGTLAFSQESIDSFLDCAAPYNETIIREESLDINLVPVVTVEVSHPSKTYRWHGSYYSKEIYTLMLIKAIKHNTIEFLK